MAPNAMKKRISLRLRVRALIRATSAWPARRDLELSRIAVVWLWCRCLIRALPSGPRRIRRPGVIDRTHPPERATSAFRLVPPPSALAGGRCTGPSARIRLSVPIAHPGQEMPRKKSEPVDQDTARTIGGLLRGLRRSAGFRAVRDAAAQPGCPAAQQTIYAYERGGLVPSLKQFMELVEFYALQTEGAPRDIRYQGVAALIAALSTPAYHIPEVLDLINRLQPAPAAGRRRRKR